MSVIKLFLKAAFPAALLALSLTAAQAAPVVLITPDEASLPPPKGAVAMAARGVTRGPKIEFAGVPGTTSPVKLSLKFQSYGGATIDLDSVRVIYLRADNVELTERVKPFITPSGIEIPEAKLPPGNHVVRVDLKDSDGRVATTSFTLKVDP
jgi:hypothetical protein